MLWTPQLSSAIPRGLPSDREWWGWNHYGVQNAVIALVALLTGDQVPGLGAPVVRVNFQQGHLSRPIDDVGVSGFANGSEVSIDFQSKRRIRLTKSDENFVDFLSAAIRTFRSDPDGVIHRRHRIGLVAREHHGPFKYFDQLRSLRAGIPTRRVLSKSLAPRHLVPRSGSVIHAFERLFTRH